MGVLRELKKALKFDSSDVSGAIEELDLLMRDFQDKIVRSKYDYLEDKAGGSKARRHVSETPGPYTIDVEGADHQLERIVYERFPGTRRAKGVLRSL